MEEYKKQRERIRSFFGPAWEPLVDAIDDVDFHNIITQNEKQILQNLKSSPEMVRSYPDQLSTILHKFLTWQIYTSTGLKQLKKSVNALENRTEESASALETIQKSAQYISGATALVEYSKSFVERGKEHASSAKTQARYYYISLIGFTSVAISVFFLSITDVPYLKDLMADDIKNLPINTGILALKVFLLIFAYQITQFFRKNYGAEKHLQEVYQHRSDVLQSLHAVYEALKDSPEERAKILSAGALFAYERGETGYITTKEGAGSAGDGLIDTLLASVVARR